MADDAGIEFVKADQAFKHRIAIISFAENTRQPRGGLDTCWKAATG